ncbi:AEC family transporter [Auritidibacter ignavus]|uniref:AEC family transporter n=1 Tax=Auritidibacter ignavus TaxID=678932 RepID=UPI0024B97235|nr:AEC family transporter [Auritidibacter ignavus]WHS27268.1 AEC family transporter [Auritidibacter ignavus]
MAEMLATMVPLFLILGLGFAIGFSDKILGWQPALNGFVFHISLPTFVFSSMVTAPIPDVVPWGTLAIAGLVPIVLAIVLYFGARWLLGSQETQASTLSVSAVFGNVGYLGIPLSIAFFGEESIIPAVVIGMVHNMVFLLGFPLVRTTVNMRQNYRTLAQAGGSADPVPAQQRKTHGSLTSVLIRVVVDGLFFNPLFIAAALGLTVMLTPFELPQVISESVALLGATAVPLSLCAVGLAIHPALQAFTSGSLNYVLVLIGVATKAFVVPAMTFLVAVVLSFWVPEDWLGVLVLMAATPSSTTVFILGTQYDRQGPLAASILSITTVASLFTVPVMLIMV